MKALPKYLIALLLLFFLHENARTQDTIFWRDGHYTVARVLSVEKEITSYQKIIDTARTIYFIDNRYLERVKFENGDLKIIDFIPDNDLIEPLKSRSFRVNLFGLFATGSLNLRYEKLLGTGRVGLFVDGGIGIKPAILSIYNYGSDDNPRLYLSGLEIMQSKVNLNSGVNFYTGNIGPVRFGTGFSLFLAIFNTVEYSHDPDSDKTKLFGSLMLNNQLVISISDRVGIYGGVDLSITNNFFETIYIHIGMAISY